MFPQVCEEPFKTPPLNQEEYSLANLKRAMGSMDYEKIMIKYPYLDREVEAKLFELYKEHKDKRSFQILFLSNIHLVYYATRKYVRKRGGSFDDLLQEGIIALLNAIEKYDPSTGLRLNGYVHAALKREMDRYNETEDRLVAFKWNSKTWKQLQFSLIEKLQANEKNSITENWIRQFAKENPEHSIANIRLVLPFVLHSRNVSLNDPISRDFFSDSDTFLDTLSDKTENVERKAINDLDILRMYNWIMTAIKNKRNYDKKKDYYDTIINDHLFSFLPRPFADIAQEFNLSDPSLVAYDERIIKKMIRDQFSQGTTPYFSNNSDNYAHRSPEEKKEKLLSLIAMHPQTLVADLAVRMGVSESTIFLLIAELKKEGRLIRIKRGHLKVIEPSN